MTDSFEKVNHAIVFVGDFKPKDYEPNWFIEKNIFTENDFRRGEIEVFHPELLVYHLDWCKFSVFKREGRLILETSHEESFEPLRDAALSMYQFFEERETELTQLGLNYDFVLSAQSEESWHLVGDRLVPKPFWKDCGLNEPGLLSLNVRERERKNNYLGYTNISISSIGGHEKNKYGIKVLFNDHYDLKERKEDEDYQTELAKEIIKNNWDKSYSGSKDFLSKLLGLQNE